METITIAPGSAHPLTVNRMGYGTMRLTGPGVWGEPKDRPNALQVLKEAVGQGVNFLDTADYYGEDITNRLIVEALHPYPADLVICTKVGATRRSDKSWVPYATPQNLRDSIDKNLQTLKIEQVQLVHLRLMGGHAVPFEESLGAMLDMQREGKILHVGLSNVSPAQLQAGLQMGSIATVENMYSYGQRTTLKTAHGEDQGGEDVLSICEQHRIPLIPYFSLQHSLKKGHNKIADVAEKYDATEAQINLAWLLHRSPWILPIPGTTSIAHLKENLAAATLELTDQEMEYLG